MYKKSFFLAVLTVISVGLVITASGYISHWTGGGTVPSHFDSGLTVEQATQKSTQPLLIEFYADSCGTCKQLTPTIHKVQEQYKGKATFVMVDVYSKQSFVADLFKIDVIPTLYLFDPKHMQKIEIPSKYLYSETDLSKGIERGLGQLQTCVANKKALAICKK